LERQIGRERLERGIFKIRRGRLVSDVLPGKEKLGFTFLQSQNNCI
jgi:hypothetical protein